jgi:hypothetical protein
MGILNAYFLPDGKYDRFYESISPVNSIRLILNRYCGARFELLPDRAYFSLNPYESHRMMEVTGILNRDLKAGPAR